jgi:hypothetical protein
MGRGDKGGLQTYVMICQVLKISVNCYKLAVKTTFYCVQDLNIETEPQHCYDCNLQFEGC